MRERMYFMHESKDREYIAQCIYRYETERVRSDERLQWQTD